jgi:hypothetical protein
VIHIQKTFKLSERRACQAIGQPRSTQSATSGKEPASTVLYVAG